MKRIMALVLSIMMIGSCFITGCGKKNESNTNKPEVEDKSESQGSSEEHLGDKDEQDKGQSQSDSNKEDDSKNDNDSKDNNDSKDEPTSSNTTTSKPSTGNTSSSKPSTSEPVTTKPSTNKPTTTDPQKPKPEQKPTEAFSGDLSSILNNIIEKGGLKDDMPGSMDTVLTADNIEGYLGLSGEDYKNNVSQAMVQEAMIISQAHMISLIKAKDANAASNVKNLIAKKFNPRRWVCVQPQKCVLIKSGSYVLFVASFEEVTDGAVKGFKNIAGATADNANVFFKGME